MDNSKIYTSKGGLRFKISDCHRPNEGDVVHFTHEEYEWLCSKSRDLAEFKLIYMLKMNDFSYDPIPPKPVSEPARLANTYAPGIIELLKGRINVEKETEVPKPEDS